MPHRSSFSFDSLTENHKNYSLILHKDIKEEGKLETDKIIYQT